MASLDEARLADKAAIVNIEEQLERDEQEEWEYEYSNTETEVLFYLGLKMPVVRNQLTPCQRHTI
jgi:hypothetical protein